MGLGLTLGHDNFSKRSKIDMSSVFIGGGWLKNSISKCKKQWSDKTDIIHLHLGCVQVQFYDFSSTHDKPLLLLQQVACKVHKANACTACKYLIHVPCCISGFLGGTVIGTRIHLQVTMIVDLNHAEVKLGNTKYSSFILRIKFTETLISFLFSCRC